MEELLSSCVTSRGDSNVTHIWDIPSGRKFYNVKNFCAGFWTFYCDKTVENNEKRDQNEEIGPEDQLWFAEIPGKSLMFTVDFKFSFPYSSNQELSPENYLPQDFQNELVSDLQSYIDENFFELLNGVNKIAVLSFSDPWIEKLVNDANVVSIFLRVQFPNMRIDSKDWYNISEELKEVFKKSELFDLLECQSLFPIEDCLLSRKADSPILMYGSISDTIKKPLSHYEIIGSNDNEITGNWELKQIFSVNFHLHSRSQFLNPNELEEQAEYSDFQDYLLPYFLSIEYPINEISKRKVTIHEPIVESKKPDSNAVEEESDFEMALRFLKMLSPKRFLLNETDWLNIGKALYYSCSGEEQGLLTWIKMTKEIIAQKEENSLPYFIKDSVEITCYKNYDTFQCGHITVRTLAWFAAKDSPELYREWQKVWVDNAIERSFLYQGTQSDLAEAFYRRYWLQYVFDPSSTKGTWYRFKNHRWHEIMHGIKGLRDVISHEFVKNYERYNERLTKQITQAASEEDKSKLEKKVKLTFKIIKDLKTSAFKNGVVKELTEKFTDENFSRARDSNYFLTGMTNGILEVSNDRVLFRDGKPEDYITMSTRIPYREDFTFNTPIVQECMRWFEMVYVDEEVREFFLKFGASGLVGRNLTKNFFIFSGDGNNSKSMIVRGFEEAWGDYVFKIPVEALSQKYSDPSKASPHLARGLATRFGFTEEPEKSVELSAGVIKRYTGNDKMFTRKLNENGGEQVMTFKTVMGTNDLPIIPNPDTAIRGRVCIIPHDSIWMNDAPPTFEEQMKLRRFPLDKNFEKKIPSLAPAFLWILVKYFPAFVKNFDQPAAIKERCQQYWLTKDLYAIYINERIQKKDINMNYEEKATNITLYFKDLYNDFKMWYRQNYSGSKTPDSGTAKSNFIKHLGRLTGGANSGVGSGWIGHQLIEEQENATPAAGPSRSNGSLLTIRT